MGHCEQHAAIQGRKKLAKDITIAYVANQKKIEFDKPAHAGPKPKISL
jgi:hypothetical protein